MMLSLLVLVPLAGMTAILLLGNEKPALEPRSFGLGPLRPWFLKQIAHPLRLASMSHADLSCLQVAGLGRFRYTTF